MKTTITIEPISDKSPFISILPKWKLDPKAVFEAIVTTESGKHRASMSFLVVDEEVCRRINECVDITREQMLFYLTRKEAKKQSAK